MHYREFKASALRSPITSTTNCLRSRAATPLLTLENVCNDFLPAPRWLGDVGLALVEAGMLSGPS